MTRIPDSRTTEQNWSQFRPTAVVLILLLTALSFALPRRVAACDCCACDLTSVPDFGDIECGDGDTDCIVCIDIGGVPATECSVCGTMTDCAGDTLCNGDPDMCIGAPTRTPTPAPTDTPTFTPTASPTFTPTATPTNTPVPIGGTCSTPAQCAAPGFCVDNVCCNAPCTSPLQRCDLPDELGSCVAAAAPAPALTPWGLIAVALLLVSAGAFTLRRRMRGH